MLPFKNFLYEHPQLYDSVFPDRVSSTYCLASIGRYAKDPPRSLLDLGCGSGSTLEVLAEKIPVCVGIDLLPSMIEYGKKVRPKLDLRVDDMTRVSLLRTFDVVCCFGWAFSYLLTDAQVENGLETMARHTHPGSLLTLDCASAEAYLSMTSLPSPVTEIQTEHYRATARACLDLDRIRLLLTRRRTWVLPGGGKVEDVCQFRLHRAPELRSRFEKAGFELLEMAGDPSGKPLAPGESTLFVTARRR
jgi:SAM-dependent methyltransferase